jgi:hypothetical protein
MSGVFILRNVATDRVLDSNENGQVYTLPVNYCDYQKWKVVQYGTHVMLHNLATGIVLDSNFEGSVYTLSENKGDYQKWRMEGPGNETFFLTNVATGRVLDSNPEGKTYTLERERRRLPKMGVYQGMI